MCQIYITGTNLLCNIGVTSEEVWNKLNLENIDEVEVTKIPVKIPMIINKSDIRRMSRYAYMAVYSTKIILDERENNKSLLDKENVGTIFNSGYGPLSTNIKFGESVHKDNPDFSSPTTFSSTVSNACVGNICMATGLKGVSTILMGSNNVGYSFDLINSGYAVGTFTGGIEEYCEPLFNSFELLGTSGDINDGKAMVSEACATLLMEKIENEEEKKALNDSIYCEVIGYNDIHIPGHPVICKDMKFDGELLAFNMKKVLKNAKVDISEISLIVTSANGLNHYDRVEREAITNVFGESIATISPKLVVGETLGASVSLNVIVGALALKKHAIPKLTSNCKENISKDLNYVLVNGLDVSGNATSILLKAYKEAI